MSGASAVRGRSIGCTVLENGQKAEALSLRAPQGREKLFVPRDLTLGLDPLASWQARPQFHVDEPYGFAKLVSGESLAAGRDAVPAGCAQDAIGCGHGMIPL